MTATEDRPSPPREGLALRLDTEPRVSPHAPEGSGQLLAVRFACGRRRDVLVGTRDAAQAGRIAWTLRLGDVPVHEVRVAGEASPATMARAEVGPGELRALGEGHRGRRPGEGPTVRWASG